MSENHLAGESSPYLLQHAHQPVDWYPWSAEAFRQAREKDRPVFLSIGYSTCHWCHVMAHESFDDAEIAKLLNEHFIAIKVDREERPDLDSVYMAVCQAMTGSGGWPMSLFLTPEQKPFFAGTYFPKENQYDVTGFRQLLMTIARKWAEDRASLLLSAEAVQKALGQLGDDDVLVCQLLGLTVVLVHVVADEDQELVDAIELFDVRANELVGELGLLALLAVVELEPAQGLGTHFGFGDLDLGGHGVNRVV